jgi:hypothetical protein
MVKIHTGKLKNHFKNLIFKSKPVEGNLPQPQTNSKKKTKKQKEPKHFNKLAVVTKRNLDGCKNHFVTYQLKSDLFTLLYSSVVFQWIESERV